MIDENTQAAKNFYKEVMRFSELTKDFQLAVFYEVKPDEINDVTLISQRVYGNRHEFLAVMAAAGVDGAGQAVKKFKLVLPTEIQLFKIKQKTGYESNPLLRKDFKPTWAN